MPRARHLVRSMSRYSQGVLAREPLNRPCRPGVRLLRLTTCSVTRCSSPRPRPPRSSTMSLKPPVVPSLDRRSPKGRHQPAADLLLAALPQLGRDGLSAQPRTLPLIKLLQDDVHRGE